MEDFGQRWSPLDESLSRSTDQRSRWPAKQSPSVVSAEDDGVGIMTEVNYGGTEGANSIE
jgi:hypothetical protein